MINTNLHTISHHFWVVADYCFWQRVTHWFRVKRKLSTTQETRNIALSYGVDIFTDIKSFCHNACRQTDRYQRQELASNIVRIAITQWFALTSWMQCSKLPVLLCQMQRRLSMAMLTTWLAVKQMDVTVAEWPVSLCRQQPNCKSHKRTLVSSEPLAASRPPHYNITLTYQHYNSVCTIMLHIYVTVGEVNFR